MRNDRALSEVTKKQYASPAVTKFGSVKSLTHGVGGSNFDQGFTAPTKRGGG